MATGAFNTSFMVGKEYRDWVGKAETTHKELMTKAGFLAEKK
jgi:putative tricarboxylic transport membrane protein